MWRELREDGESTSARRQLTPTEVYWPGELGFQLKIPFWRSKVGSGEVSQFPQQDLKARHDFTRSDLQKDRLFQPCTGLLHFTDVYVQARMLFLTITFKTLQLQANPLLGSLAEP